MAGCLARTAARERLSETKKRFCPTHGTKAKASAIPPKLTFPAKCPLATRTIIRAPMDNGWGPVSPYLESSVRIFRSKPPSEAHSPAALRPVSTLRDSLWPDVRQLLFFFTGFSCITLLVLYAFPGPFVNFFFQTVFLLSLILPSQVIIYLEKYQHQPVAERIMSFFHQPDIKPDGGG